MRWLAFARRNAKEILRDPLTLAFGVGFPVVLILLLTLIQRNIPVPLFELDQLTPGVVVFGYSFLALFAALLISKDRSTSFLLRLFSTPMTAADFILGYLLPMVPMAAVQCLFTYLVAAVLGLPLTVHALAAGALSLLTAVMFISLGLLLGTVLNDKQVGGVCGALLTNLSAWLSGTWFSLALVGGWFEKIAFVLPFANGVELGRAALAGQYGSLTPYLWWCLGYAVVLTVAAVLVFRSRMRVK
ncbi:MAG: ABC transporter permease [Candidatus Avoscillospira sp.]